MMLNEAGNDEVKWQTRPETMIVNDDGMLETNDNDAELLKQAMMETIIAFFLRHAAKSIKRGGTRS